MNLLAKPKKSSQGYFWVTFYDWRRSGLKRTNRKITEKCLCCAWPPFWFYLPRAAKIIINMFENLFFTLHLIFQNISLTFFSRFRISSNWRRFQEIEKNPCELFLASRLSSFSRTSSDWFSLKNKINSIIFSPEIKSSKLRNNNIEV